MARDGQPTDIVPGSTWYTPDEKNSAMVVSVCAGYVVFVDAEDGASRTLHHTRFRERFVEPYDAKTCRSRIATSLAVLDHFHVFYSSTTRKTYSRTANIPIHECYKPARGRPALPADAFFVATYSSPMRVSTFFEDLHDALATWLSNARRKLVSA